MKMLLQKLDGSGEYSPLVFSLKERHGVRDHGMQIPSCHFVALSLPNTE